MQRLDSWDKIIDANKRASQEFVSDPVPFRTVEVNQEEGKTVLQVQILFEVLGALIKGLNCDKPLRKSSESVIWFLLSINMVNNVLNRLCYVHDIYLRLRGSYFSRAEGKFSTIREIDECKPFFVGWCDATVYEVLYWRVFGVSGSLDECELAKVAHSVDKILHLIHHDFAVVIVAMKTQNTQLFGFLLVIHFLINY